MTDHKNRDRAALKPLNLATLALSVGGLGFLRPAPGTWGSMPPVALVVLMAWSGFGDTAVVITVATVMLLASAACVVWGQYGEQRFGRKDAAEVVADETAGVCLPVLAAIYVFPEPGPRLIGLLAAFLLFRLFDIAKPWPMKRLEQLPAGWGVLVDDLAAGVYAALIVLHILLWKPMYLY